MNCDKNWAISINRRVDFYVKGKLRKRTDPEFPWELVDGDPFSVDDNDE